MYVVGHLFTSTHCNALSSSCRLWQICDDGSDAGVDFGTKDLSPEQFNPCWMMCLLCCICKKVISLTSISKRLGSGCCMTHSYFCTEFLQPNPSPSMLAWHTYVHMHVHTYIYFRISEIRLFHTSASSYVLSLQEDVQFVYFV